MADDDKSFPLMPSRCVSESTNGVLNNRAFNDGVSEPKASAFVSNFQTVMASADASNRIVRNLMEVTSVHNIKVAVAGLRTASAGVVDTHGFLVYNPGAFTSLVGLQRRHRRGSGAIERGVAAPDQRSSIENAPLSPTLPVRAEKGISDSPAVLDTTTASAPVPRIHRAVKSNSLTSAPKNPHLNKTAAPCLLPRLDASREYPSGKGKPPGLAKHLSEGDNDAAHPRTLGRPLLDTVIATSSPAGPSRLARKGQAPFSLAVAHSTSPK